MISLTRSDPADVQCLAWKRRQLRQEFQIMLCPFLWRDYEHLRKTMEGPVGKELADKILASHGIKILDFLWVNGPRHLTPRTPRS